MSLSPHLQQLRQRLGTNNDGTLYTPPPEPPRVKTDREREYEALLLAAPRSRDYTPVVAPLAQTEPYEEAFARFRKMWLRNLEAEQIKRNDPDFRVVYTSEQAEVVRNLVRYFINDPACPWPLDKGIYLYGGVGSGKSELMFLFSAFTAGSSKEFAFTRFPAEVERAKKDDEYDIVQELSCLPRCIDEVGYTDPIVVRFGNRTNVFEATLHNRAYKFTRSRQPTHLTSNLTPTDLATQIDSRIADRLVEMCTPVLFHSPSHRQ